MSARSLLPSRDELALCRQLRASALIRLVVGANFHVLYGEVPCGEQRAYPRRVPNVITSSMTTGQMNRRASGNPPVLHTQ